MKNCCMAWIVFFAVLGAALDDFPDPPATDPHGSEITSIFTAYVPQFAPAPVPVMFAAIRTTFFAAQWSPDEVKERAAVLISTALIVTQSSDASPPFASASAIRAS